LPATATGASEAAVPVPLRTTSIIMRSTVRATRAEVIRFGSAAGASSISVGSRWTPSLAIVAAVLAISKGVVRTCP
jgi:hypothetical protein